MKKLYILFKVSLLGFTLSSKIPIIVLLLTPLPIESSLMVLLKISKYKTRSSRIQ